MSYSDGEFSSSDTPHVVNTSADDVSKTTTATTTTAAASVAGDDDDDDMFLPDLEEIIEADADENEAPGTSGVKRRPSNDDKPAVIDDDDDDDELPEVLEPPSNKPSTSSASKAWGKTLSSSVVNSWCKLFKCTSSATVKLTDADDVIVLSCVVDALLKKASTKRKLTDADDLFTPGTGPGGKRSKARQTAAASKKDRKTQLPIAIPDTATRELVNKWHSTWLTGCYCVCVFDD